MASSHNNIASLHQLLGHVLKFGHKNYAGQVVSWVTYTTDMAHVVLTQAMYNRQRDIRPANLKALMAALDTDTFLNNNVVWFCQMPDGSLICINAQHTLEAILQTKVTKDLMTVIAPVTGIQQTMQHYGLFDAGAARTQRDINRALDTEINFNEGVADGEPWMATEQDINKATQAASWLMTGLRTNNLGPTVSNIQKLEVILHSDKWRPEFVLLHRLLGPLEDDRLGPNQRAVWKAFYKGLTSATYMPVLMVRLRAQADEAETIIKELVEKAKNAYTPTKGSRNGVDTLYNWIFEPDAAFTRHYGSARKLVVRRFAQYVRHAFDAEVDIRRIDRLDENRETWDILTDGSIPTPDYDTSRTRVDVVAAKARRFMAAKASKASQRPH